MKEQRRNGTRSSPGRSPSRRVEEGFRRWGRGHPRAQVLIATGGTNRRPRGRGPLKKRCARLIVIDICEYEARHVGGRNRRRLAACGRRFFADHGTSLIARTPPQSQPRGQARRGILPTHVGPCWRRALRMHRRRHGDGITVDSFSALGSEMHNEPPTRSERAQDGKS